jgi:hypothetical protein
MIIENLSREEVAECLQQLLLTLAEHAAWGDVGFYAQKDILESLIITLDVLDSEDTFGPEGWRETYGFKDT